MEDFNQRYNMLNMALEAQSPVIANYLSYKKINQTIYISGQLPWQGNTLLQGKVGLNVTLIDAVFAARMCAQQVMSQLYCACNQDLNLVEQCISLQGYVNCVPDFTEISEVINGASDLIIEVFGDSGKHTRIAVGVNSLPRGSIAEIQAVFQLKAIHQL